MYDPDVMALLCGVVLGQRTEIFVGNKHPRVEGQSVWGRPTQNKENLRPVFFVQGALTMYP